MPADDHGPAAAKAAQASIADAQHGDNGHRRLVVGRFAPSPTGSMHAGNIFAALNAWLVAKSQGGQIVMRIEDLDEARSKREYADKIMRDFEKLGLTWDVGPIYQSDRKGAYEAAFQKLARKCEVYPCFCSRADLKAQSAPHEGEHHAYDGTCRKLNSEERLERAVELAAAGRVPSYRVAVPDSDMVANDLFRGQIAMNLAHDVGDFVVKRADGGFAYQLAVVVDDAEQGVNSVVRGCDLVPSTPQQAFLCQMLGYEVPQYAHIPLLCAADGRRLSKRDADAEIDELIDAHGSPEAVLGHIAYVGGLVDEDAPATAQEILYRFDIERAKEAYQGRDSIVYR